MLAQYQPRLKPFTHRSPLPHPRTLTKVSARLPSMPGAVSVALTLKVPLQGRRSHSLDYRDQLGCANITKADVVLLAEIRARAVRCLCKLA